jgi:5-methylcytosine-specific restriction endonuclease McrA
MPVVSGGTSEDHNLQAACRHCNSAKGARIIGMR